MTAIRKASDCTLNIYIMSSGKKYSARILTPGMTEVELTSGMCWKSDIQQLLGVKCSIKHYIKIVLHVAFSA